MAALTIIHKIHNAVSKIGTVNGTKITEPEYGGEGRSNADRVKWFQEWAIMAEYMVAKAIKQRAEKREEDAKSKLEAEFAQAIAGIKIGDTNSIVRGNVTITFNRRNAQRRINRQAVINTLSSSDYNWKLDDINEFLSKIEHASPDGALYITPSTTME
jgi:hypothetical protein